MTTDVQIVQRGIIGKGSDYDHYILTDYWIDDGAEITISDSGSNNLEFIYGLDIASSMVAQNAFMLTLTNGAVITVLDAASYDFSVGRNPLIEASGFKFSYQEFASEVLGVDVPISGVATGGAVEIGSELIWDPINVEPGLLSVGTDRSDTFIVDVSDGGNFAISNIDVANDAIKIEGLVGWPASTLADLVGQPGVDGKPLSIQENPFDGSVILNLGFDETGEIVTLTINGITVADAMQISIKDWNDNAPLPTPVPPVDNIIVKDGVSIAARDGVPENFILDLAAGGNLDVSAFNTAEDLLTLSGLESLVGDTLNDLIGQAGLDGKPISSQENPFTGSLFTNFGVDAEGEVVSLNLGGLTLDDLSAISVT